MREQPQVFDTTAGSWDYAAIVPDLLRGTRLPLPTSATARIRKPT